MEDMQIGGIELPVTYRVNRLHRVTQLLGFGKFCSQTGDITDSDVATRMIYPIRKQIAFKTEIFNRASNSINGLVVADLGRLSGNLIRRIEQQSLPFL